MNKHPSRRAMLMLAALALAAFGFQAQPASAQGTAFTYQGQLYDSGSPAAGIYDLEFTVFDAVAGGALIAGPLTNASTPVNGGLFTVTLDFGPVFNGSNYWLEIGARTNGAGSFSTLTPRQPLTPAPYAIYAATAGNAVSVSGVLPGGGLSGAYSNALALTNAANQFGGQFAGNGSGLSNLPATNLSGAIPSSSLNMDAEDFTTNLLGQIMATNADMSVNLGNLPNLTRALASNVPPRFLWFGDSTGIYILPSFRTWLQNYSVAHGIQLSSPFNTGSWGPDTNCQYEPEYNYFWNPGGVRVINPGTNCYCGRPGAMSAPGNQIEIWLLAGATNGAASLSYSSDFENWTLLGTLNEAALGEEGLLFVTNFPVPLGKYAVRLSGVSGTFRWADCIGVTVTNNTVPILYDMHAVGTELQGWTNMGQNIAVILSNVNPCVTFYEQTKPITSYNDYTNFAWWMSNYAPNSDVVLISSYQDSSDPPNGPVAGDNLQRDLIVRGVAITNHWPFVDVWTPLGTWSNIVAEGLNADNIVHLNAQGQNVLSQIVMQKLNFAGIWQEAGLASIPLNYQGDLTITSTDYPNSGTTFGAIANDFSVMSFNAAGNWASAGQWSLGSFTGVPNPATFLKGNGGVYFETSGDSYGKLWPDGGWSFMDVNRDPNGSVDPGGPGVLLVNTITNFQSMLIGSNLIVGASASVSNDLIVGSNAIVSSNLTVGAGALVGTDLMVGDSATVSTNLTVGTSAIVGSNLTVGDSAYVSNNLIVGTSASVSGNFTVGTSSAVSSNLTVGASVTVGSNLIVGTSATVGAELAVGDSAIVSNNLTVGANAAVGSNLTVGTSVTVGAELAVGDSAIVSSNLTVGTSATIGSNLTVGTSATVGAEFAVGDSATVSTNLTVGASAAVGTQLAVGDSAIISTNLTVGTSAAIGAELSVGDSATISTNLTVGLSATVGADFFVGASATITNDLTVGTSATVGAELAVGDSATISTNLTVGGVISGNLSLAATGFASGATSLATNITAATWVNTNSVNGSIWVSGAVNLAFFNSAGVLVFGPVTVTNAAFPVGPGWTVTNSAAAFNFSAF